MIHRRVLLWSSKDRNKFNEIGFIFCLLSKQKIDINGYNVNGLTLRQESILVDILNAANLNFFRKFSNGSKNFSKEQAENDCVLREQRCVSGDKAEIRDTMSTYRARDRGGAASVPRRRRDVDYMLSSGRPRIFVGWCLLDRHEKGIASRGVATLAELGGRNP